MLEAMTRGFGEGGQRVGEGGKRVERVVGGLEGV